MFTGIITDIGTITAVEQRGDLRKRGCRAMQGYLFSRPLGVEEFGTWFEEQAAAIA